MAQQHKACTKCGEVKPLDEFHKHKRGKYGVKSRCKGCEAEYQRRYREENREERLEYNRRYYDENRDEILDQKRRYGRENREAKREYRRRYYEENREKELERARRYREENQEAFLARERRYREENREIINAKNSSYMATNQELTKALSSVPLYTPWSEEEDAFLMADNGMTVYEKATHLGRTYNSCESRRHKLTKLRRTTNV